MSKARRGSSSEEGEVAFVASFKPMRSAVRLDGSGDGGELVLEFDRSQLAAVVEAWARYGGELMLVRFSCADEGAS